VLCSEKSQISGGDSDVHRLMNNMTTRPTVWFMLHVNSDIVIINMYTV